MINSQAIKLIFVLVFAVNLFAGNDKHKEYFISLSGSDKNIGSIEAPFATIERARDAVREDKLKSTEYSYTVYLREGIYNIENTIEFDDRDSGSDSKPIVYRSYNNEKVRISGGIQIPKNKISSITDTIISRRFITRVKNNILQIDYSGININEGKILPHGFGRPYTNTQME
ncbi:MAG: hypothetical protein Q8T08_10610, partial [Ignavibacteria bacterium]|nr:hypothetical protein [Ignavibacteria bacterium]